MRARERSLRPAPDGARPHRPRRSPPPHAGTGPIPTMRILYVTAHYPPDFTSGATLQVARIARNVVTGGHEVAVLSGAIRSGLADGETRTEVVDGVTVHWIATAGRIEQDDDD